MITLDIHLPKPHAMQEKFIHSPAKRKVVKAGRRGGKTVGMSIQAVEQFLAGHRVLYAAPTQDQLDRFWTEVCRALDAPIRAGIFVRNQTKHTIEIPGTEQRIKAKTAWNADTLRGDYADVLILDEFQMMNEDTWEVVGAPMLMDNNGNVVFVYTPPSLRSRANSKARDPQFAAKLFKRAEADETGAWESFHFTSYDNPYISREGLDSAAADMTSVAYRMEILAEDVEEAPGSLWKRATIDKNRVMKIPELERIVVAIDPTATASGDEAGIIVVGSHRFPEGTHYYVIADKSQHGSPLQWSRAAITAYNAYRADLIVAETNNGGEMVETTLRQIDTTIPYQSVHASRGKAIRAEPVAVLYEQGRVHHVGEFPILESEMCLWFPGEASPNRMDALVWGITSLPSDGNDSDILSAFGFGR
jgi:hypothetical protein